MRISSIKSKVVTLLVALIWLSLWQVAAVMVGKELLVPSPAAVARSLAGLLPTAGFWLSATGSLLRIAAGFGLGVFIGAPLAVLCSVSPPAHAFFKPALSIVKATPVASFIILALVWVKSDSVSVFMSMLMVLPIVWGNIFKGIGSVDRRLLEVAKVFRFGRMKTLTRVYVPSVMPYFLAACTSAIGLAWKAGIAAEVLGVPEHAIGTGIYRSKIYLETPELFAWTLVVILLSVLLEKGFLSLLRVMERRLRGMGWLYGDIEAQRLL